MSIREVVNKQGKIIAPILLVLAVAFWFILHQRSTSLPTQGFFVDEETGEEKILPNMSAPPLMGSAGKPTVMGVFKFSCDRGKTVKVGYYYKFDEKTKQHLDDMASGKIPNDPNYVADYGKWIRLPAKGSPWVKWDSNEGGQIRMTLNCPGGDIEIATPPQ